jgi:hypothetical protein
VKPAVTKSLLFVLMIALPCSAQNRRRVILDQDGRGPATTDQQSMLLMLQSPLVETLGITIVSGDQWRDEEVAHTLRMLELTGHKDVKVYPGAIFPLINSKEEIGLAEALWRGQLSGRVEREKGSDFAGCDRHRNMELGSLPGSVRSAEFARGKSHC